MNISQLFIFRLSYLQGFVIIPLLTNFLHVKTSALRVQSSVEYFGCGVQKCTSIPDTTINSLNGFFIREMATVLQQRLNPIEGFSSSLQPLYNRRPDGLANLGWIFLYETQVNFSVHEVAKDDERSFTERLEKKLKNQFRKDIKQNNGSTYALTIHASLVCAVFVTKYKSREGRDNPFYDHSVKCSRALSFKAYKLIDMTPLPNDDGYIRFSAGHLEAVSPIAAKSLSDWQPLMLDGSIPYDLTERPDVSAADQQTANGIHSASIVINHSSCYLDSIYDGKPIQNLCVLMAPSESVGGWTAENGKQLIPAVSRFNSEPTAVRLATLTLGAYTDGTLVVFEAGATKKNKLEIRQMTQRCFNKKWEKPVAFSDLHIAAESKTTTWKKLKRVCENRRNKTVW